MMVTPMMVNVYPPLAVNLCMTHKQLSMSVHGVYGNANSTFEISYIHELVNVFTNICAAKTQRRLGFVFITMWFLEDSLEVLFSW